MADAELAELLALLMTSGSTKEGASGELRAMTSETKSWKKAPLVSTFCDGW